MPVGSSFGLVTSNSRLYIGKIRSYNNFLLSSSNMCIIGITKVLKGDIFNNCREIIKSTFCIIYLNAARY